MRCLLWIVIAVVAVVAGCRQESPVDRADRIVAEHPDSVLRLLTEADSSAPRHALLSGYAGMLRFPERPLPARDWDSLLTPFTRNADRNAIRALLVRAYAAKHTHRPVAEMECLKDAEFLASRLDDSFNLALVYRMLSSVFDRGGNSTLSLYYADKSVAILRTLDYPFQLLVSRMQVTAGAAMRENYSDVLDTMTALENDVRIYAPADYKNFYYDQLAGVLDAVGKTGEALEIWERHFKHEASCRTLAYWARALIHSGECDSARRTIERARNIPHSPEEEYTLLYVLQELAKHEGRDDDAQRLTLTLDSLNMDIWTRRQPGRITQIASDKAESATVTAWRAAEKQRTHTAIAITLAIIISLSGCLIIVYYRKRTRLLKATHENDMLRIHSLQQDLTDSTRVNSDVAALFPSRFDVIDRLARSYFESKETAVEQKRIHAEVKETIAQFSSPEHLAELENTLNAHTAGVMASFRNDFPKLTAAQYRLALLLFCGFSLPSVSIFTGTELRNLYVYKSRLKSIINKSGCQLKDTYLAYFSK